MYTNMTTIVPEIVSTSVSEINHKIVTETPQIVHKIVPEIVLKLS